MKENDYYLYNTKKFINRYKFEKFNQVAIYQNSGNSMNELNVHVA